MTCCPLERAGKRREEGDQPRMPKYHPCSSEKIRADKRREKVGIDKSNIASYSSSFFKGDGREDCQGFLLNSFLLLRGEKHHRHLSHHLSMGKSRGGCHVGGRELFNFCYSPSPLMSRGPKNINEQAEKNQHVCNLTPFTLPLLLFSSLPHCPHNLFFFFHQH